MESILVVEDRVGLRQVYAAYLREQGYGVAEAGTAEEAMKLLEKREFSLILTDYLLPGTNGLDFLKRIKERDRDCPVIIMTAFGEIKLSVAAVKAGAFDFLEKPIDLEYLKLVIDRALQHRRLDLEQSFASARSEEGVRIVGESDSLRQAIALAEKVAPADTNCLLLGESGVGKELFAKLIHERSPRARGPMVSINCASIPHELLESELFGHEKGAFTGAVAKKTGLVEMAEGGTLFLDEIGELPLNLQPKLLRVIQTKEFFRVGGSRVLKSDLRLVCATNRDLKTGIREGWFREDLFYRLAVFPIEIAPLRERAEDVAPLVRWFLERKRFAHPEPDPELLEMLCRYAWPGNVRELENVLDRAVILSQGGPLQERHFPEDLCLGRDRASLTMQVELDRSLKHNLDRLNRRLEEAMIRHLLNEANATRDQVARRMGISVKTLYNKIQTYGIDN